MYRHIDGAATVVLNLDHLLIARPLWHAHQSAKLAYAVVDVHHVVANLELLYFLQRQRHLAATGFVGAQVVLMEAVENLVVGEDTQLQVVIHETGMEGTFNRIERHGTLLGKDVAQAFQLLGAVCQDAEAIAASQALLQRLLQQVEILVELGLWRSMESDGGIGHTRCMSAHLDTTEGRGLMHELRSGHELSLLVHLFQDGLLLHLGSFFHTLLQGLRRETFVVGTPNGIVHIQEVLDHQHRIGRQKREKRHPLLHHSQLRHYLHLLALVFRQLGVHLESADRVYVVTEEVYAERQLTAVGVDIQNAAT